MAEFAILFALSSLVASGHDVSGRPTGQLEAVCVASHRAPRWCQRDRLVRGADPAAGDHRRSLRRGELRRRTAGRRTAGCSLPRPRGADRRRLDSLGQPATADTSPGLDDEAHRIRSATADHLAQATVHGAVVVGRGGMVVLRRVPGVLHVRLDGPREARVERAMRMFGIDRRTAERRRRDNDRMRIRNLRRTYGLDMDDPDLYHLRIDSTVLDWDSCVDVIVSAARARTRRPADNSSSDSAP